MTYEEFNILTTIKSFLDAPVNARPYIHSIYVYLDNPNKQFLAAGEGLET